jgi:AcrR family transcriptional regulator
VAQTEPQRRTLYDRFLRKKPQQSRSESVVDAILFAGIEIMLRSTDEESLAVRDVAERAGVGIASVYDYFRDRDNLLAGLSARLVDHNRARFEKVLQEIESLSLRASVERFVDETFKVYLETPRALRISLQIAQRVGLIPAMAASQTAFSRMLADALRKRSDIEPSIDYDAAAYVIINSMMGIVHTMIWDESWNDERERIRKAMIDGTVKHLEKR